MNRRSLLGAMLAACAAPAYVKAGILMPVRQIITPPDWKMARWGVDWAKELDQAHLAICDSIKGDLTLVPRGIVFASPTEYELLRGSILWADVRPISDMYRP